MSQKQEILLKLDNKTVEKFRVLKQNVTKLDKAINNNFGNTLERLSNKIDKLTQSLSKINNINPGFNGRTVRQTSNLSRVGLPRGSSRQFFSSGILQNSNITGGHLLSDIVKYVGGAFVANRFFARPRTFEELAKKTAERGDNETIKRIIKKAPNQTVFKRNQETAIEYARQNNKPLVFPQYNDIKTGRRRALSDLRQLVRGKTITVPTGKYKTNLAGSLTAVTESIRFGRMERIRGALGLASTIPGISHARRFVNWAGGIKGLPGAVGGLASAAVAAGSYTVRKYLPFEVAEQQLKTLYKNEGLAGGKVFQTVKNISAQTPLTLANTMRATSKLAAYGVKAKDTSSLLLKLGDLSRGKPQALETAATVFGRANKLGYLQGMERNMLVDATGFDPLTTYAKIKGKSVSEVFKMMGDREFTIDKFQEALDYATGPLGRFGNMLEEVAQTTKGQIQIMGSQWDLLMSKIGEPIAKHVVNPLLKWVTNLISSDDKGMLDITQVDTTKVKIGNLGKVFQKNPAKQIGAGGFRKILEDEYYRNIVLKDPNMRKLLENSLFSFMKLRVKEVEESGDIESGGKIKKVPLLVDGKLNKNFIDIFKQYTTEEAWNNAFAIEKKLNEIEYTNAKIKLTEIAGKYGGKSAEYKAQKAIVDQLEIKSKYYGPNTLRGRTGTLVAGINEYLTPESKEEKKPLSNSETDDKDDKIVSGGTRVKEININIEELFGIKAEKWDKNLEDSSEDIKSQVTTIFNEVLKNVETMA